MREERKDKGEGGRRGKEEGGGRIGKKRGEREEREDQPCKHVTHPFPYSPLVSQYQGSTSQPSHRLKWRAGDVCDLNRPGNEFYSCMCVRVCYMWVKVRRGKMCWKEKGNKSKN